MYVCAYVGDNGRVKLCRLTSSIHLEVLSRLPCRDRPSSLAPEAKDGQVDVRGGAGRGRATAREEGRQREGGKDSRRHLINQTPPNKSVGTGRERARAPSAPKGTHSESATGPGHPLLRRL